MFLSSLILVIFIIGIIHSDGFNSVDPKNEHCLHPENQYCCDELYRSWVSFGSFKKSFSVRILNKLISNSHSIQG